MATGTGNLPNQGMSFSPFAILTAEEQNNLVENIESLATGSGIGDGAIATAKIADSAVTSDKIDWTTLGWQTWTPTLTGFSSPPSGATYRYQRIGNTVTCLISMPNNGTSNATSFTISLPFQAANIGTGAEWRAGLMQSVNNGTVETTTPGLAIIEISNPTVITTFRNLNGSLWTASGGKRIPGFVITYECAP